jgi:hypothetical protein
MSRYWWGCGGGGGSLSSLGGGWRTPLLVGASPGVRCCGGVLYTKHRQDTAVSISVTHKHHVGGRVADATACRCVNWRSLLGRPTKTDKHKRNGITLCQHSLRSPQSPFTPLEQYGCCRLPTCYSPLLRHNCGQLKDITPSPLPTPKNTPPRYSHQKRPDTHHAVQQTGLHLHHSWITWLAIN